MNTRKLRWLSHSGYIINLDKVDEFYQEGNDVEVIFNNGHARLKNTTLDDIRHYLKYGKPKRR